MIAGGQAGLNRLYALAWPPKPARVPSTPPAVIPLDDDEQAKARARAARNGASFEALYRGDMNGCASESEARGALIFQLIFHTQGNAAQIERIIRSSARDASKFDTRRGTETFLEYEIRRALEDYTGDYYTPPRTVHVTAGTSTEDRLAALEAEVAELRRTVRDQQEIIETQRGRLHIMELEAQAVRNAKLKQAGPTLVELSKYVDKRVHAAKRDPDKVDKEGFVRIFTQDIAPRAGGISQDSVGRYLDVGARAGLHTLERRSELTEVVDENTGEIKTVPVRSFWVKIERTLEEQLQEIAAYNPPPEERARVVNKPTCRKHPTAGVIVFKTYKCKQCGDTLDMRPSDDPEDEPEEDTPPQTQVAVANHTERGSSPQTQLAVTAIPLPSWTPEEIQ